MYREQLLLIAESVVDCIFIRNIASTTSCHTFPIGHFLRSAKKGAHHLVCFVYFFFFVFDYFFFSINQSNWPLFFIEIRLSSSKCIRCFFFLFSFLLQLSFVCFSFFVQYNYLFVFYSQPKTIPYSVAHFRINSIFVCFIRTIVIIVMTFLLLFVPGTSI